MKSIITAGSALMALAAMNIPEEIYTSHEERRPSKNQAKKTTRKASKPVSPEVETRQIRRARERREAKNVTIK